MDDRVRRVSSTPGRRSRSRANKEVENVTANSLPRVAPEIAEDIERLFRPLLIPA